ncbi:MAG: hypothetical protein ACFFKA_00630 [Candidatus Thorarchaeota archaeon]
MKKIKYYFSNECKLGAISISDNPFCEHCMELEPYKPTISDGSTRWCMDCWDTYIGDEDSWDVEIVEIPEEIKKEIKAKVKSEKIKYYTAKLKELKEE